MSLIDDIIYSDRVSEIKAVQFGISSPKRIRAQSVAQIYRPLSNPNENAGTIDDPRLGATEKRINYASKLSLKHDPGNFGHLELAKPVMTTSQNHRVTIKILNSICYRCANLKIDKSNATIMENIRMKQGPNRLAYVTSLAEKKQKCNCLVCGAWPAKFKDPRDSNNVFRIHAELLVGKSKVCETLVADLETEEAEAVANPTVAPEEEDLNMLKNFNMEICLSILSRISDQDVVLLGLDPEYSRPEWMIWQVMPIPPPSMRPSVETEDGITSSDDLTNKLNEIVKVNHYLVQLMNARDKDDVPEDLTEEDEQEATDDAGPAEVDAEANVLDQVPAEVPAEATAEATAEDDDENEEERPKKKKVTIKEIVKEPKATATTKKVAVAATTAKEEDVAKIAAKRFGLGVCKGLQNKISEQWCLLQYHVATYIDNEISYIKPATSSRSSRPLKTLRQRIKSKRGRIRKNLMGKRVNYSARSVITPEPNISIDQLGIPKEIAMILTWPETVTVYNYQRLTKLVRNGPFTYPGANYIKELSMSNEGKIIPQMKQLKYIDYATKVLSLGTVVYRHIMDDDLTLFNRQPSLHKMSMMAHRAKILMEGNSFRLNPNVTSPYNADFDGDEMNAHMPRSLQTKVELQMIASVSTQIVSPQASKPVMGLVQDSLLGCYRYTNPASRLLDSQVSYNTQQVMHMLQSTNKYHGKLPDPDIDGHLWSAQAILSYIMPLMSYRQGAPKSDKSSIGETCKSTKVDQGKVETTKADQAGTKADQASKVAQTDTKDTKVDQKVPKKTAISVEIDDGKFASTSILNHQTVGKTANSLFHVVWNDLGPEETRFLFDNLSQLSKHWLLVGGFSVGYQDIHVERQLSEKNRKIVQDSLRKINTECVNKVHQGQYTIENRPSIREQFEMDINTKLNVVRSTIESDTYDSIEPSNRIHNMVTAGSKGKKNNIVQIMAMLGQQDLEGGRIPDYFYRRTLPHFAKDSIEPEAKGFVTDSFLVGLSPTNYWAHAQSGRIGVISTSIKTAETGYIQRKLIKMMEDAQIAYDGTVRNSMNLILQFLYGNDGFDGTHIETITVNPVVVPKRLDTVHDMVGYYFSSDLIFVETFKWIVESTEGQFYPALNTWTIRSAGLNLVTEARAVAQEYIKLRQMRDTIRLQMYPDDVPDAMMLPFNCQRLIDNVMRRMPNPIKISDLIPSQVVKSVDELIARVKRALNHFESVQEFCMRQVELSLRANLSSKYLIQGLRMSSVQFTLILEQLEDKITRAYISAGEMVGSISAQSIGEPTTQLTLNVFHQTGQGSAANVSRGVPRMKEIMDLSKNPKTPSYSLVIADGILYKETTDPITNKDPKYNEQIEQIKKNVKGVMDKMVYTSLKDLSENVRVVAYTGSAPTNQTERDIIAKATASASWKKNIVEILKVVADAAAEATEAAAAAAAVEVVAAPKKTLVLKLKTSDEQSAQSAQNAQSTSSSSSSSSSPSSVSAVKAPQTLTEFQQTEWPQRFTENEPDAPDNLDDEVDTFDKPDEPDAPEQTGSGDANELTVWIIDFNIKSKRLLTLGSSILDIFLALMDLKKILASSTTGKKQKWKDLGLFFNFSPTADPSKIYFQIFVTGMKADDPIAELRVLTKKISNVQIRGIVGIEQAYCRESKPVLKLDNGALIPPRAAEYADHKTSRDFRLVIDTNNTGETTQSLYQIFNMTELNFAKSYSNNIQEVMEILGIEAARQVIGDEIHEVLEFAGTQINRRHIDLLADVMTVQGYLVPISRYGVNKSDSGPFARASFEETASQVSIASQYASVDKNVSVTSSIMMGQFIKAGTNSMEILIDEALLMKDNAFPAQDLKEPETEIGRYPVPLASHYCANEENFKFDFVLF